MQISRRNKARHLTLLHFLGDEEGREKKGIPTALEQREEEERGRAN